MQHLMKTALPIIILSLFTVNCSKTVTSQKIVTPNLAATLSGETDASYEALKAQWTVNLVPVKSDAPTAGGMGGPGGRGGGRFPLNVTVSLMDAQVIEAGFNYYTKTLNMTADESEAFRQHYLDLHQPEKYILIEATLQTSWTEMYLDLDRWTIFLEDNQGNQHEPERISEQSIPATGRENRFSGPGSDQRNYFPFEFHQKQVFLYFPRKDFYGEPIMHQGITLLKMVFIQEEGFAARAEGVWAFDWDNK